MAVAGVTNWFRPPSVISSGNWSNASSANDSNASSFASFFYLGGGGGSSAPGTWGGFSNALLGLPIDALITGIQIKATGSENTSGDTGPYIYVNVRIDDQLASSGSADFYQIGTTITRSTSAVGEFSQGSVQNLLYPLTVNELSKILIRSGWGGSVATGRTVVLYLYDLQVQFSYLIPSEGKRFSDTGFKTATITSVNSPFGSDTVAWQNPSNAVNFDSLYATLAEGKEDSTVLFGSNWQFNIPKQAIPIAIVPKLLTAADNTYRYSSASWEYRATDGGSLLAGGDSSRTPAGWIGGKGLLNSSVSSDTLNSSWFGFGFRRDETVVGDFTYGAGNSLGNIDQFSAKIVYEEDKTGGIMLIAGF